MNKTSIDPVIATLYEGAYNTFKIYTDAIETTKANLHNAELALQQEYANQGAKTKEALAINAKTEVGLNAYISIAQGYTNKLIAPSSPLVLDSGKLARLSVQVNGGPSCESYAAGLYTEATGQLMTIKNAAAYLNKKLETAKQELLSKHDVNRQEAHRHIDTCINELIAYMCSTEFNELIALLREDEAKFGSSAVESHTRGRAHGISIGTVQAPLPVPDQLMDRFAQACSGIYDKHTGTIGLPISIDISAGAVVIAEYSYQNENILLSGIQNILLNIARHSREGFSQIAVVDPVRLNNSALGCLEAIAGGASLLEDAPPTIEHIRKKVADIMKEIAEEDSRRREASYSPQKRLLVFHNFPHEYDSTVVSQIKQLCVNASRYGITVILTSPIPSSLVASANPLGSIKYEAVNIESDDSTFSVATESGKCPFMWYQAPQALPESIKTRFTKEKPEIDTNNLYESRVDISSLPHYQKGNKRITDIPYGIDDQGKLHTLGFEGNNFAAFICGASQSGKTTLLHTIITGIVNNMHPDDVEIWLIDFKMTEFSRYIDCLPPHVRYIILDQSPELVYDILNKLTAIMVERGKVLNDRGWRVHRNVPPEEYMPTIFVIIDEFSIMSQFIYASIEMGIINHMDTLENILKQCASFGIKIIFADQGFEDGAKGLTERARGQIQQRITLKALYKEMKATLDIATISESDKLMIEGLPEHYALRRVPVNDRGSRLLNTHVLHTPVNYPAQKKLINNICTSLTPTQHYDATNPNTYFYKHPVVYNGNRYNYFSDRKPEMAQHLAQRKDKDYYCLFLGEPRRMTPQHSVNVVRRPAENILLIAPSDDDIGATSEMGAISIVMSTIQSLYMQNTCIEFWSGKNHTIFRHTGTWRESPPNTASTLDEICEQISQIKGLIQRKKEGSNFFILLGIESFISDMRFEPPARPNPSPVTGARQDDQLFRDADKIFRDMGIQPPQNPSPTTSGAMGYDDKSPQSRAYDAREDLKFIIEHGPRLGYHFFMHLYSYYEFKQCNMHCNIHSDLFKHKLFFKTPKMDAFSLVDNKEASAVAELKNPTFRYASGNHGVSLKPYLHPGLKLD